eukprot:4747-Heterococcus_DN1.PRE.1
MAPPVPQAWPAQGARARRHVDLLQVCAAEEGRYDLLKQLHMECGCPWNVGAIAKAAAASGQDTLSVLQWLWEQPDGKWGEHDEVCKAVAQAGDVTVLQWMYDNQALFDEMLCTEAARGNKYLHLMLAHCKYSSTRALVAYRLQRLLLSTETLRISSINSSSHSSTQ